MFEQNAGGTTGKAKQMKHWTLSQKTLRSNHFKAFNTHEELFLLAKVTSHTGSFATAEGEQVLPRAVGSSNLMLQQADSN